MGLLASLRSIGSVSLVLFLSIPVLADYSPSEPHLYLAGSPTADTLRQGEIELGPPWGGWIAGGINDQVTLGWDYPAALFAGIPAFMARASLLRVDGFELSVEGYAADWRSGYTDQRNSNFLVLHKGLSSWAHALLAWRANDRVRLHFYGGANYANYESYSPNSGPSFSATVYQNSWSPDLGATFEWDATPWLLVTVNAMEGNSFYYVDQISRKYMALYALDLAPFSPGAIGILRTFRLELAALWLWMPVAGNYRSSLGLPLFPSVYWQFNL